MVSENCMEGSAEKIIVDGKTFRYLKNRLSGGKVFVSEEGDFYLRTATIAEVKGEVNLTRDLHRRGFPVPEVVSEGALKEDVAYYIEKSIGKDVFGEIFRKETKELGCVGEESFSKFIELMKLYCEAQFDSKNFVPQNREDLPKMVHLANVMRNNPPSPEMQRIFFEAYEKASERVMLLPWGYIQADLNAFNILPAGIIDFELAGFGPVGYDVLTNVYFGRMWPKKRVAYIFTNEQIARYKEMTDAIAVQKSLPKISDYENDFLVLKAIWSSCKDRESEENPESNPDFWRWRVQLRDWCIKQYLRGERIDTEHFLEFDEETI